jgi:hypothetical protein
MMSMLITTTYTILSISSGDWKKDVFHKRCGLFESNGTKEGANGGKEVHSKDHKRAVFM